jgi:Ribosomal protein L10.
MRGLEWKIKEVEDLKNAIRDHKVVGLVGMEDLPSKQLQEVRNRLRGK